MKSRLVSVLALGLLLISILTPAVCQLNLDQRDAAARKKSQSDVQQGAAPPSAARLCVVCIRSHLEFLASDACEAGQRHGGRTDRGDLCASELRAYGIEPAGADGGYLQRANLVRYKFTAARY